MANQVTNTIICYKFNRIDAHQIEAFCNAVEDTRGGILAMSHPYPSGLTLHESNLWKIKHWGAHGRDFTARRIPGDCWPVEISFATDGGKVLSGMKSKVAEYLKESLQCSSVHWMEIDPTDESFRHIVF